MARCRGARPASSKIWISKYAEFEEFLRTAKIDPIQAVKVGVTGARHAFFAPAGLGNGAAIKLLPPGRHVELGRSASVTFPTSDSDIATTISTSSVDRGSPLIELAGDPPTR